MRCVLGFLALASLTACVTGPGPRPVPASGAPGALTVCPGVVSNAPAIDRHGAVAGFEALAEIGGARLLRAPVAACLSSGFGPRRGGAGAFHNGVDLYTGSPRPVIAGGDGVVEFVGSMRGYGRTVVIRHTRHIKTRYAHLSSYEHGLREGRRIRQGDLLGNTGKTGNATAVHLHYEFLINGRPVDPLTASR